MVWRSCVIGLLLVIGGLLATISILQWQSHPVFVDSGKDSEGVEYKDLVVIILTALGVMIAVATIVLAALAIWGFSTLREEASRIAREVAPAAAREAAEPVAARTATDYLQMRGFGEQGFSDPFVG